MLGRARWPFAIAIAVAAFAFYLLTRGRVPANADTARDLLLAQKCLAGLGCGLGQSSSWQGLSQGALWFRFLAACSALGLGIAGTHVMVLALAALSAGLLFLILSRHLDVRLAATAALFYVFESQFFLKTDFILWNPSLLPLPVVVSYGFLLEAAVSGGTALLCAAAASLALATNSHIVCAALWPLLLGGGIAFARRPVVAPLLAAATFAATLFAESRQSWTGNLRGLPVSGWLAAVMVTALVAGVAAAGRARLLRVPRRAVVVLWCAGALTLPIYGVAYKHWDGSHSLRYLFPVAPPLAIAAAWIVERCARVARPLAQIGFTAAVLGTVATALTLHDRPMRQYHYWSMAEAQLAARRLAAMGFRGRDLFEHLTSTTSHLRPALAAFLPLDDAEPQPRADLLLVRVGRCRLPATLPADWSLLPLEGDHVAVFLPSAFTPSRGRACYRPDGGSGGGCVDYDVLSEWPRLTAERREFLDFFHLGAVRETFSHEVARGAEVEYTVSLRGPLDLKLLESDFQFQRVSGDAAWRIRRASCASEPALVHVPAAGCEVTFARRLAPGAEWMEPYWPPALIGLRPDDDAGHRLLDAAPCHLPLDDQCVPAGPGAAQ